ncbi:MAG: four helix bundle protein [Bacteroidales bacterium]|nr:four helix bundle protein [Bacteroidales bacterium]
MTKVKEFEDFEVWKRSIDLAVFIYQLTMKEPLSKDYSLKDQIRRASTSVSNNIAEGFEYGNNKQFARFLRIAKGSLGEVRSQIVVLKRLDYISEEDYHYIYNESKSISKQMYSLINYLDSH